MYVIRKAKLDDITSIMELIAQRIKWMDEVGINQWNKTKYFQRYPKEYFQENIDYFFVAYKENKLIGVLAGYLQDDRWPNQKDSYYIHHLTIDLKEKGFGITMLKYMEELSKKEGKKVIRLDSAIDNEKLTQYYEKLGYQPVGYCYDGLYTGILREKKL